MGHPGGWETPGVYEAYGGPGPPWTGLGAPKGAQGHPERGRITGSPPEADVRAQACGTSFIAGPNGAPTGRENPHPHIQPPPQPCQPSLGGCVGASEVHRQPVKAGDAHVVLELPSPVGARRPGAPPPQAAGCEAHGCRGTVDPHCVRRLGAGSQQLLGWCVHKGVGGLAGPPRGRHLPACQHGLAVAVRREHGCPGVVHMLPQELLIAGLAHHPCQHCQHQGRAEGPACHGHLWKVGVRAIWTSGPPTGNPTLDAQFPYIFPCPDTCVPYRSPLNA